MINLNDIGNALKPSVLPGEALTVKVVKPGEEPSQGVGYLEDGTMVVIEAARDRIGQEVNIVVTSELQTSAGRMLFGRLDDPAGPPRNPRPGAKVPAARGPGPRQRWLARPTESPPDPARSPQPNPNQDLEDLGPWRYPHACSGAAGGRRSRPRERRVLSARSTRGSWSTQAWPQATPQADAAYIVDKVLHLRIFPDEAGKMNLDVVQAGGRILLISAFTTQADARKGRRPSFDDAMPHEQAEALYERLVADLRSNNIDVQTGRYREHMLVESTNDGPICILLDSRRTF